MSTLDLNEFSRLPFPEDSEIVYVLCYRHTDSEDFKPFYVGKTGRSLGRFGDYQSAQFTACTDFKVGRAVRRLRELGYEVVIFYRGSATRTEEERDLIARTRDANHILLNDLQGYNYKTAIEDEELKRVHEFIDTMLGRL